MINTAVIGGTSDSVIICKKLENKCELTVFAATVDGANIMSGIKCECKVGRLDKSGFSEALSGIQCVVDASHPFAVEVSENVRLVCAEKNIPYIRYCRKRAEYDYENIIYVKNKEAVVNVLNSDFFESNILFTTGAKTARFYMNNVNNFNHRAVLRVMESTLSHNECGNMTNTIIYKNPPFSADDNIELIRKYNIGVMVSKDSGVRGGVCEKVLSCKQCGIPLILIEAPSEAGTQNIDDIIEFIEKIGRK